LGGFAQKGKTMSDNEYMLLSEPKPGKYVQSVKIGYQNIGFKKIPAFVEFYTGYVWESGRIQYGYPNNKLTFAEFSKLIEITPSLELLSLAYAAQQCLHSDAPPAPESEK
jgi:hypothetical protein